MWRCICDNEKKLDLRLSIPLCQLDDSLDGCSSALGFERWGSDFLVVLSDKFVIVGARLCLKIRDLRIIAGGSVFASSIISSSFFDYPLIKN